MHWAGERKIINTDKYNRGSFAGNGITSRNNCVEAELNTMSIRASDLGKTPSIQATVKSGEEKMRIFDVVAAERAANEVTELVVIFAKTTCGLRQMPGDKMIKGLPRGLRLNTLYVGTYTEAHQVELEDWEYPETTIIGTGMFPTRRQRGVYLDGAAKEYTERIARGNTRDAAIRKCTVIKLAHCRPGEPPVIFNSKTTTMQDLQ